MTEPGTFERLAEKLDALAPKGEKPERVFYLSVAPFLVEAIGAGLAHARLLRDAERSRIVVEKPFGMDLQSARDLDKMLLKTADESQIYRIDHYLARRPYRTSSPSGSRTPSSNPSGTAAISTTSRSA